MLRNCADVNSPSIHVKFKHEMEKDIEYSKEIKVAVILKSAHTGNSSDCSHNWFSKIFRRY